MAGRRSAPEKAERFVRRRSSGSFSDANSRQQMSGEGRELQFAACESSH